MTRNEIISKIAKEIFDLKDKSIANIERLVTYAVIAESEKNIIFREPPVIMKNDFIEEVEFDNVQEAASYLVRNKIAKTSKPIVIGKIRTAIITEVLCYGYYWKYKK